MYFTKPYLDLCRTFPVLPNTNHQFPFFLPVCHKVKKLKITNIKKKTFQYPIKPTNFYSTPQNKIATTTTKNSHTYTNKIIVIQQSPGECILDRLLNVTLAHNKSIVHWILHTLNNYFRINHANIIWYCLKQTFFFLLIYSKITTA